MTEEHKSRIREKDAKYQREKLKEETDEGKKIRNEKFAEYMKEKREREKNETVKEKMRRFWLKKGIGIVNGKEASWISKSAMSLKWQSKKEKSTTERIKNGPEK